MHSHPWPCRKRDTVARHKCCGIAIRVLNDLKTGTKVDRERLNMASAQWNSNQQGAYRGTYEQQTPSYITGYRAALIRQAFFQATELFLAQFHTCCSDDFFGNTKSKSFGLYVIVPEGYQCAYFFLSLGAVLLIEAVYRYALEKFGKYFCMLQAGMHILVPFIDEITFTRCLKTGLLDCPPQVG